MCPRKLTKQKKYIGEMTSPSVEPVYTQVDMSAVPASDTATSENIQTGSVSMTYTESSNTEETSEEFFDDSDME